MLDTIIARREAKKANVFFSCDNHMIVDSYVVDSKLEQKSREKMLLLKTI